MDFEKVETPFKTNSLLTPHWLWPGIPLTHTTFACSACCYFTRR